MNDLVEIKSTTPSQLQVVKPSKSMTKSTLAKAIRQAKRMSEEGKFDSQRSLAFLKLLTKESQQDIELEDELWRDWVAILRDLVQSDDDSISSDALNVLAALYASHPDKMEKETPKSIQALGLGKLMTTKVPRDQSNLIDFIFSVMLSNDKLVSEDVNQMRKAIEANQSELADLKEQLLPEGDEPDKTPRQLGTTRGSRERSEVDMLKKNLNGLEQKVAKLMTASVTVGADGAHNIQIDSVDKSNLLIDKSVPDVQQKSRYGDPQKSSSPLSEKGKTQGIS